MTTTKVMRYTSAFIFAFGGLILTVSVIDMATANMWAVGAMLGIGLMIIGLVLMISFYRKAKEENAKK